ncbi:MAG: hypothetical protein ACHQFW_01400 [Chitinophagales bacterium]
MKKLMLISCLLVLVACTSGFAQTTVKTTTTTTTVVASQPIKLSSDMVIYVPSSDGMIYEYEIQHPDIKFRGNDERERYFSSLNDDVVSYTYDSKNDKIYLRLNNTYIDEHKWSYTDINNYFSKRSNYMKDQYGNYIVK